MANPSKIILYAGALHGGGGIAVATNILTAILDRTDFEIVVVTGSKEISTKLKQVLAAHPKRVEEKKFGHNWPSGARYIYSKLYFLMRSLKPASKQIKLVSINFYLPWRGQLTVYHVNLLSFTDSGAIGLLNKLRQYDAKTACRRANRNMFESKYLLDIANSYLGFTPQSSKIAYLGVDGDCFTFSEPEPNYDSNSVLMVTSGQTHKRNHDVLEALRILTKKGEHSDIRLRIAGGFSEKSRVHLLQQAELLGVNDRIEFLPYLKKQELSAIMRGSLCLVTASVVESFCMVAVEAMASFCPAIVTNTTSMPESVGEAAIVVNACAPNEIAIAIIKLRTQAELRTSLVAKGRAWSEQFSIAKTQENFIHSL